MLVEGRVGPQATGDYQVVPPRISRMSAMVTTDAHARYYEAVTRGNVYYIPINGTPTAFTGGGAGTPLVSIYNPTGSGKNLVVLAASCAMTAVLSAAGVAAPELWAGVSVAPTGTATVPVNAYTQVAAGSVARGSANAATTSSSAITLVTGLPGFWWATAAAGAGTGMGVTDIGGMLVVAPGVLAALGCRTAPAGLSVDAMLMWEEVTI